MCVDLVTLCLHHGGVFNENLDYVGGHTYTYENYDICWAFDDSEELLENLGYTEIVKVGVRTCSGSTFKFLEDDENEWKKYVGEAIDKVKKTVDLYFEALTENSSDGDEDFYLIEESDPDDVLDECDFSDEDDEVLQARYKIRQHKLDASRDHLGDEQAIATLSDKHVMSRPYANDCEDKKFKFQLGMKFSDRNECKEAIIMWNILNGHNIKWLKSSKDRLKAACVEGCPWSLYASKLGKEPTFCIKVLNDKHTCVRAKHNRQATSHWIAKQFLDVLKMNPNTQAKQLQKEVHLKFGIQLRRALTYKAKGIALHMIRGSCTEDYRKLRSYVSELRRSDEEGRFELMTYIDKDGNCIFQRIFIGFSALRKGFIVGCRRLIGFDACFLKTVLGGVLLAAIGKDSNQQMYPIAWAVVEKENEKSWSWFCEVLFNTLGIDDGLGWCFMSDKQKGLINAILKHTPNAEHRHCARHVYANWKKMFGGQKYKGLFWSCVKANTIAKYEEALNEMKALSIKAFDEFCSRAPKSFCKSLISPFTKTETVDNNICESFNSFILNSRDKPILHLLEDIRQTLMARMYEISNTLARCQDEICPNIRKRLQKIDNQTRHCNIIPAIGGKYEVIYFGGRYIVDLSQRKCTCVDWDLSGIPCCHAYACINHARMDVKEFVDPFFYKATCVETYRFGLEPLLGENEWPKDSEAPVHPPHFTKLPGRPKKLRKRNQDELRKHNPTKITKHATVKMTCSNCGIVGHNKRGCTMAQSDPSRSTPSRAPQSTGKTPLEKSSSCSPAMGTPAQAKQPASSFGLLVADSGNVFWRNHGSKRAQFVATSRAPTDYAQVGGGNDESRLITRAPRTSQNDCSQVVNPTPPS